jgi:hypothetical protein
VKLIDENNQLLTIIFISLSTWSCCAVEAMEKQSVNEEPTFNTFSAASSVTKTNNSIAFVRHTSNIP